jgi:enterochelin esterase-like enzyme
MPLPNIFLSSQKNKIKFGIPFQKCPGSNNLELPGFPIFDDMHVEKMTGLIKEHRIIFSDELDREVTIETYRPAHYRHPEHLSLLLINDGQNMDELGLGPMLRKMLSHHEIEPIFCVAIYAGPERKMEYGTARLMDYEGRGALAGAYTRFIFNELLPFIRVHYHIPEFRDKSFAGFSLGGLSALDIAWNHPHEFTRVGVFSGSLWWRTRALNDGYLEERDRIMHAQIREGGYYPWLRFFFETGILDETMDRNDNGIIDSIDDTLGLIDELVAKGYDRKHDIHYLELADGKHDIATWARAMPEFLRWGWGRNH